MKPEGIASIVEAWDQPESPTWTAGVIEALRHNVDLLRAGAFSEGYEQIGYVVKYNNGLGRWVAPPVLGCKNEPVFRRVSRDTSESVRAEARCEAIDEIIVNHSSACLDPGCPNLTDLLRPIAAVLAESWTGQR